VYGAILPNLNLLNHVLIGLLLIKQFKIISSLKFLVSGMLESSVDTPLAHYSPFLLDDGLVEAAKQALNRAQLLVLNERGEPERCSVIILMSLPYCLLFLPRIFDLNNQPVPKKR
jgi:hypothetical protein